MKLRRRDVLLLVYLSAMVVTCVGLTGNYYVRQAVTRYRPTYYTVEKCCSGWRVDNSGTHCGIHNKYPIVAFCPADKTVMATGRQKTRVTWQKATFREPEGYGLSVTSTYGGETFSLPWGDTTVTYVATSANNNKQKRCSFTISVTPPLPKAKIPGHFDGGLITVDSLQLLVLECRAEYGKPAAGLTWYRGGVEVMKDVSYTTELSDHSDYRNALSTLTLYPTQDDHDVTYECRTSPAVSKYSVKLEVMYEARPEATYCPDAINVVASERWTTVKWKTPGFRDPRYGEPVDVVGSLGLVNKKRFGWGVHTIAYTATNRRSHVNATCKFVIRVWPPGCNVTDLTGGENGAVACGFWPDTNAHICQPFCSSDYDVFWMGRYADLYICGKTGRWWPKAAPLNCSHPRNNFTTFHLPSSDQYYSGACAVANSDISSVFSESVAGSPYSVVCGGSDCMQKAKYSVACF